MAQTWRLAAGRSLQEKNAGAGAQSWFYFPSATPTLSVFTDVPMAQKLEGSLLKTYKQDDNPNKMFLAYKGRSLVIWGCETQGTMTFSRRAVFPLPQRGQESTNLPRQGGLFL